jgi:hypothetical protein
MLRRVILILAIGAALGGVGLAPQTASAGGWHRHHHRCGCVLPRPTRVYAGRYAACMTRGWFYTQYGPVLRWVNRCY